MSRLSVLLGHWSAPPDVVARGAVLVAALLFALALLPAARARFLLADGSRTVVVTVSAFVAGFLSLGYVVFYLHGGPRIVDATMYFLQGRALSHGAFAWPLGDPSEAVRGRFLYAHDGHIGGIFPPGYPLILALGFKLGAPLAVGPFTAIALVLATYALGRSLARNLEEREAIARTAALLSVVCAALRYHTADTMAHGVCALEIAVALLAASEGSRWLATASVEDVRTGRLLFVAAALVTGLLGATRPVSAIGVGVAVVALALSVRPFRRVRPAAVTLGGIALGVLPGLALLLVSQHAVTGHWLGSTQRAYYATSDGPPGCFRYGFGAGIGCLGEHGDFVRDRLPHGYTVVAALLTTLRRLHLHLRDVMSFEPLALLVLVPFLPLAAARRARGSFGPLHAAGLLVLVHVLAYAPFYFDGDYPGGGARFFADLLPVEHVLAAVGLYLLVARYRGAFPRFALGLVALSLLAFGVHAVHDHRELAARDGGAPMYETHEVQGTGAEHGLVFFDTDHGFDLAYDPLQDPAVKGANKESESLAPRDPDAPAPITLRAVRKRGDDGDRLVYDKAGHPQTFRYLFDPQAAPADAKVEAWTPTRIGPRDTWRFEAESSWPPLEQHEAWAEPVWIDGLSGGRALVIHGPDAEGATGEIDATLPVPGSDAVWTFTPRVDIRGIRGHAELTLGTAPDEVTWTWDDTPPAMIGPRDLATQNLATHAHDTVPVRLKVSGQVTWDRTMVRAR